jgi:hypothetical protein
VHMIRKGQLSEDNIPAYKQFMEVGWSVTHPLASMGSSLGIPSRSLASSSAIFRSITSLILSPSASAFANGMMLEICQ